MSSAERAEISTALKEKLCVTHKQRKELAAALDKTRKEESIWKNLLEAQSADRVAEIVTIFRQESDFFKALRSSEDEIVESLEKLYRESEEEAKVTARRFANLFPSACDAAGIELDSNSRHPKYSIKGFIQVHVDERNFKAEVSPRDANTKPLPLDIDTLISYLKSELERLFGTPRDQKRFLSGLRKAYDAVLREEKRSPGDEVPLRRVANRLSKNWARFRYDEFNVDLGAAVISGKTNLGKERLHLNHTRDTRQGMLLHGLERSGYMGFISFKREES